MYIIFKRLKSINRPPEICFNIFCQNYERKSHIQMHKFPYRTLAAKKIKAILSLTASLMISFFFSFLYCRESHWLGMITNDGREISGFYRCQVHDWTHNLLPTSNKHPRRLQKTTRQPPPPIQTPLDHAPCPLSREFARFPPCLYLQCLCILSMVNNTHLL